MEKKKVIVWLFIMIAITILSFYGFKVTIQNDFGIPMLPIISTFVLFISPIIAIVLFFYLIFGKEERVKEGVMDKKREKDYFGPMFLTLFILSAFLSFALATYVQMHPNSALYQLVKVFGYVAHLEGGDPNTVLGLIAGGSFFILFFLSFLISYCYYKYKNK